MEMIDIVNEKDEVIGQAAHEEIYSSFFNRRIVHVLVFNQKGEMAMQFRSKKKLFCPHHWSTAVVGHVQAGEEYEEAAKREMFEEIGVNLNLEFFSKDTFRNPDQPDHIKFLSTYTAIHEGPFKINVEEVEKFDFFSLDQIQKMIDNKEKFHPELLFLLLKHFSIK